jgi:hypothetical protein
MFVITDSNVACEHYGSVHSAGRLAAAGCEVALLEVPCGRTLEELLRR